MQNINVCIKIIQPDIHDYNLKYPKMPCNTVEKQTIFDILTDPENINGILINVEATGSSPISFYKKAILSAINRGIITTLTWHEKQFTGAVACVVMESNGWRKTGRKQRFSKGIFKSAEIYVKNIVEDSKRIK